MKKYDYIIIGGGSSGLVTASKLIKHGFNVLIIEEGQKNNNPILKMPAGWIPMLSGSPYHKFYKSIPQKQLNNRQHDIAQAKILGGGSSINGMVYMRGKPSDYKNWKIATADNLWDWESLLKNYIKLESNQRIKNKFHGQEGPLKVSDPGFIAEGSKIYIDTMKNLGLPFNDDFNNGNQYGTGYMQFTIDNGKRCDAVKAFLSPINHNDKLKIFLKTIALKIIIENKKAIGVEILHKGKLEKVYANNEVILTAGSLISPKLLMLSGIGNEEELKKFDIKIIEKLNGVGKNLQDHHEVPFISKAKAGFGYHKENKGWRMIKNGIQYLLFNSGPVRSVGVECCSFLNPENILDHRDPKIKLYYVPAMYTDRDTKGLKEDHGVTLTSCIMNPQSRGEVTLQSSNPLDRPLINPNFLSHQNDREIFINSIKLSREIINSKPLNKIIIKEILPGNQINNNEEILNYCKKMIKTNWHPVGTCKMGKENDEMTVLNSKLQVKGIDNLRVFDVSMMPNIVSANTNAPAMAIANNATDMLLNS